MRYLTIALVFIANFILDGDTIKCLIGKVENVAVATEPTDPTNTGVCEKECAIFVKRRSASELDYRYGCGTIAALQAKRNKVYIVGDWVSMATTRPKGNTAALVADVRSKPVACIEMASQTWFPQNFGQLPRTTTPANTKSCFLEYNRNDRSFKAGNSNAACSPADTINNNANGKRTCCTTFMCDPTAAGPLTCLSSKHADKPIRTSKYEEMTATKKQCSISYNMETKLWSQAIQPTNCINTPTSTTDTPKVVTHCCGSTNCNSLESTASMLHCYNNGQPGPLTSKFNLLSGDSYCVWTKSKNTHAEYVQTAGSAVDFGKSTDTDCGGIHGRVRTTASHYVFCCKTMLCNRPTEEWMGTQIPPGSLTCYSGTVPNTATTVCTGSDAKCYWKYTPGNIASLPKYEQGCSPIQCKSGATCSLGSLSNVIPVQGEKKLWCYDHALAGIGEYTASVFKQCGAGETCYTKLQSDGKIFQGCAATDTQTECKGKMETPTLVTNDIFTCCNTHGCNIPEPISCLYKVHATSYPTRTISKRCPIGTQSCRHVGVGGLYLQGCAAPGSAVIPTAAGGCNSADNCNIVPVLKCFKQTKSSVVRTVEHTCTGKPEKNVICYIKQDASALPAQYTTGCIVTTDAAFTTNCQGKLNELVTDTTTSTTQHVCCTSSLCNNALPPTTTTTTTTMPTAIAPSSAIRHFSVVTLLLSLVSA